MIYHFWFHTSHGMFLPARHACALWQRELVVWSYLAMQFVYFLNIWLTASITCLIIYKQHAAATCRNWLGHPFKLKSQEPCVTLMLSFDKFPHASRFKFLTHGTLHHFATWVLIHYWPPGLLHPSLARKKKAYVRLTQDYDALDVANRIGII